MSAAVLLDRLERVKQTAPGRWLARCPAHEDRSPSLSIRELEDGRVLLHDFGGCSAADVLAALSLEMSALFPERLPGRGESQGYAPSHSRIPAADLLEAIDFETSVLSVIAADLAAGRPLTDEDRERLTTAARRIHAARDMLHGR